VHGGAPSRRPFAPPFDPCFCAATHETRMRIDAAGARITVLPMPTLTFKATAEEARAIREAALREKLNLSAYLRRSALRVGGKPAANPRLVRSPRTGAYVVAAPRGAPTLTSAKVRELLADFP